MAPAQETGAFTYRLDLAYEGTDFRGFARQPEVRTVQGELEKALSVMLRENVPTTCAGRTDAGVHARRQVVSMTLSRRIAEEATAVWSLNRLLPSDMAVHRISAAEEGWSARFSACWRAYRYQVRTDPRADPLTRRLVWHLGVPLDVDAMNRAAALLAGTHDFASFCRAAEGRSTVREVREAQWRTEGAGHLTFEVLASSFCQQMVRSMVGWCVEVGRGRREASETPGVLAARNRQAAGQVAPPQGLILWEVGYGTPGESRQGD
ncbi:MAG: tRNA pseudouridine(38-40) synthase TruA [Acidimicrobiia bacterium]|nr:tRNA pseudouridine(38-40) synthase TruA [Acidimicrobiia bacterium]MYD40414.1 tRNA pseudouridine(38-40) synthase TruA [Acidimicrobiia bacterium]